MMVYTRRACSRLFPCMKMCASAVMIDAVLIDDATNIIVQLRTVVLILASVVVNSVTGTGTRDKKMRY